MELKRLFIILTVLTSCNNIEISFDGVTHYGALRPIMSRDLSTVLPIDTLEGKDNLYVLEGFIRISAVEKGFYLGKPFPFLIEGEISSLDWHVIDWPEGDMVHTHKKHKISGLNGTIKEKEVEIIGFFSLHHKGVFTHHTTNMHMHFRTEDSELVGHLDDLQLGREMTLKLPRI